MEHLLHKLARQLDAIDEASLMALWDNYAEEVSNFTPTKRWEEAALVFSFIQAKRWKNQLFNHHWALQMRPVDENLLPRFKFELDREAQNAELEEPPKANQLTFKPKPSN